MLMMISFINRHVPDEIYRSLDAVGDEEKWWEVVILIIFTLLISFINELKESFWLSHESDEYSKFYSV